MIKFSKITIILFIFIALFVVNACNSETINKPKPLTQDILDENGKKLFKITVENIGDMIESSGGHTTLLLDNGKVLIGSLGHLEIFDPKTNKFNYIINEMVCDPIFLKDNSLYYSPFFIYEPKINKVIEHYKNKVHNRMDKYNKEIDNFNKSNKDLTNCSFLQNQKNKLVCLPQYTNDEGVVNNTQTITLTDIVEFTRSKKGKLNIARDEYDLIMLKNGEILIIGGSRKNKDGFEEGLKSIEMYNPKTGEVKLVGNMHYSRIESKSILLKDGRVLITGGYINTKIAISRLKSINNAEIFDPKTGKLIFVGDYKQIYYDGNVNDYYQLGLLKDGKVLLYGSHINLFDPKVNKFYQADLLDDIGRNYHQLTILDNGKALITGGEKIIANYPSGDYLKYVELVTIENY